MTTPAIAVQPTSSPRSAIGGNGLVFLALLTLMWGWALWICAGFWSSDDDYSYGFVVPPLMVLYLWRRFGTQPDGFWKELREGGGRGFRPPAWLLVLPAFLIFPVEVYRSEYHQSGIVLWAINGAAVALALAGMGWLGGRRMLLLGSFPVLFYLTAVPWPARLAHPLQQNLMIGVAQVVSESLLWLGVPVETNGAVLKLTKGTVGIVEACSGIRSLQSGLMISLAIGELLMLSTTRRWGLFGLTMLLALVSNFGRTFTLCWIMENRGPEAMDKAHDIVGNVAMYSFYLIIWLLGKWLAIGNTAGDEWPRARDKAAPPTWIGLPWGRLPDFRPFLAVMLVCLVTVHAWYAVLAAKAKAQTEPLFTPRLEAGSGVAKTKFDERAWEQLHATAGAALRHTNTAAPYGVVDSYHLFWKPSPVSRRALGHRPDSCMPGSGWKQVDEVGRTNAVIDGVPLDFYVFRFERSDLKAVQLWGVWRNGRPVQMDYGKAFTAQPEVYRPWPTDRHLLGVELVSCFMPYPTSAKEPPISVAMDSLAAMYRYRPFQP